MELFEDDLYNLDRTEAFVYADSAERFVTQLPLALAWSTQSGVSADDLYTDDDSRFVTYASGENFTVFASRIKDRFGSISVEVVDGSFSGYIQTFQESVFDEKSSTIAGPYTISGDASGDTLFLASYYAESPAVPQSITFSGSGSYNIIFPKPVLSRSFKFVHSGTAPYKISRTIPRRAIQSFDLEVNAIKAYHVSASLIETIALEVSDSIVVGPDLIGDKTLTGAKIIDGTISGVLITPGTITANEINVSQLSAIATNTGSLNVTDSITIVSGVIDAGRTLINKDGITIRNSTGLVSDINAIRVVGSGTEGDIVGMAFYNTVYHPTHPQATIQIDGPNTLEIDNKQVTNPAINLSFKSNATSAKVAIFNGGLDLRRTSDSSVVDSPGIVGYNKSGVSEYAVTKNGVLMGGATALQPSYRFMNSPNAGIYSPASNVVSISTDGTQRMSISNTAATFNVPVNFNTGWRGAGLTLTRTSNLALTTAGTIITWQQELRRYEITWSANNITIPRSGWYHISLAWTTTTNVASMIGSLIVNSLVVQQFTLALPTNYNISIIYFMRYLTANDIIQLAMQPSANTDLWTRAIGNSVESPLLHVVYLGDVNV